jgi:hypothetical protein
MEYETTINTDNNIPTLNDVIINTDNATMEAPVSVFATDTKPVPKIVYTLVLEATPMFMASLETNTLLIKESFDSLCTLLGTKVLQADVA